MVRSFFRNAAFCSATVISRSSLVERSAFWRRAISIIRSYISSPTHLRAYWHHCTQLSASLYATNPHLSQVTWVSVEKISMVLSHTGQVFSRIVGVRGFP